MIVAQARLPTFYRDYGVADTVNGRFELIVLHLAWCCDRLAQEPALQTLGQGVFDRFCLDMDDNLREMGVGDLKVPKEMQRMARPFMAARRPIGRPGWPPTMARWCRLWSAISMARASVAAAPRLAAYVRRRYVDLATQPAEGLAVGDLRFPEAKRW